MKGWKLKGNTAGKLSASTAVPNYINDLCEMSTHGKIYCFADDKALVYRGSYEKKVSN